MERLPEEVLLHIFSFIQEGAGTSTALLSCRLVNSKWANLISDSTLGVRTLLRAGNRKKMVVEKAFEVASLQKSQLSLNEKEKVELCHWWQGYFFYIIKSTLYVVSMPFPDSNEQVSLSRPSASFTFTKQMGRLTDLKVWEGEGILVVETWRGPLKTKHLYLLDIPSFLNSGNSTTSPETPTPEFIVHLLQAHACLGFIDWTEPKRLLFIPSHTNQLASLHRVGGEWQTKFRFLRDKRPIEFDISNRVAITTCPEGNFIMLATTHPDPSRIYIVDMATQCVDQEISLPDSDTVYPIVFKRGKDRWYLGALVQPLTSLTKNSQSRKWKLGLFGRKFEYPNNAIIAAYPPKKQISILPWGRWMSKAAAESIDASFIGLFENRLLCLAKWSFLMGPQEPPQCAFFTRKGEKVASIIASAAVEYLGMQCVTRKPSSPYARAIGCCNNNPSNDKREATEAEFDHAVLMVEEDGAIHWFAFMPKQKSSNQDRNIEVKVKGKEE